MLVILHQFTHRILRSRCFFTNKGYKIVKPENRIFVFRDQSPLRIAGRFSLPYIKQASFAPIAALVFLRSIFVYFLQKPTAPNAQTSFRILLRYTHGLNIFLAARSKFRYQNI